MFLLDAKDEDRRSKKKEAYWSAPHEMAARAFSVYVADKLEEQGRRNDYLASDDDGWIHSVYPGGEERKRINAAFDKLFRVVAETNAIRKALAAAARRKPAKAGKRWLWVDGDGKVWVRKGVLTAWRSYMAEQRD